MIRTIEKIGEGCVFIRIDSKNTPQGLVFHRIFSSKEKPPLEVILNPNDGSIICVKYYIFKEKVVPLNSDAIFLPCELKINCPAEINENNYIKRSSTNFVPMSYGSCLLMLRNECSISKSMCYSIDDNNGLLFQGNLFAGIKSDNLTPAEKEILISSGCL